MLFDSHIHSFFSDGIYPPAELWKKIVAKGLGGWALTDHDTMEGVEEATQLWQKHYPDKLFVGGCEFSTHHPEVGEVHILAYFGSSYEKILPLLAIYRRSRIRRAKRMVELLRKEGYHLDWDELVVKYDDKPLGRMHLARELVEAGYFSSPSQVFHGLLDSRGRCYVPREEIRTEEVIQSVVAAGGVPVLAHPAFLFSDDTHAYVKEWIQQGLMGIEYRHPRVPEAVSAFLAKEYGSLFLVSGSDFHDDGGENDLGKYGIPLAKWENFLSLR
ncbi:PHP domain-containing protein [Thermospira aquatica]|uniref:PHP domain-containing protein n=1 Tax=Thermospira aquatica TaxID=2828656 RepID=A0AAX3BD98_9SPIR|nr:PHP domain-containing protein [Thermospira aquatica]URA10208.1 PHP domain-containing protein [Thermospira aquatica]